MSQDKSVDVVIVTALKKECDAVLRYLNSPQKIESNNGVVYKSYLQHENSNSRYQVLLLCLGRMGNVEAGIAVTHISHWNPIAIILTGIMGGVRSSDRLLGDLVVAEQIVGYELGKVTDTGMESRWKVLSPTRHLIEKARHFSPEKWAFRSIIPRPNGSTGRVPTVHFGVVASGEKVVADTSTIPELQGTWKELIGVEMESFGVASAVDRLNSAPGMLMVKGICDWADPNKNDEWQEYAADVAAAYVINFLKCNSIGLGVEDGYLFKSQEEVKFTDILLESSGFSKGKQENLPDLDFSAIPPKSIQQAYRKAFAPDADLWEENDISQILERLKENKCEGAFYQLLSEDKNIDGSMRQKIQEKAKKYPQENKERQYERRESYLIATLKPVDDEFWLNGWLVTGEHQNYLDYLKNCESLLKDNPTESVIKCQLEEVESWLDNFIEQCFKFLPEDHQLIIEVFLPIDLLHTKVEWWNFTEFDYKKRPIGTEYSVRLRSVERLQRRYLDRHSRRWKEKWRRVKSVLEKPAILEHFGYFDSAKNCDFTEAYLMNQLDDKIGVKLMSCPPKHKRQELFMAIMKSGLPIALWSRYNLDNRDREIEQFFNLQRLCSVCDSIRKKRLDAFAESNEVLKNKHLGSHLAVIWENPYRLTPDAIVGELTPPGK